jgi:hypothetical protein
MNGDELKPEHPVPIIDPPEGLSQKNAKQFLVLYRGEATLSSNIEVELGGVRPGLTGSYTSPDLCLWYCRYSLLTVL